MITVDHAPASGVRRLELMLRRAGVPEPAGLRERSGARGGGQVGALLLSPFIKVHAVSQEPYNHFSLLGTIEQLFGVSHLGYAAARR